MLYLGWDESASVEAGEAGPWFDLTVLRPGLVLIDSASTRSEVYHAFKHLLPQGTAVLVAPLADAPKWSRLAPGTGTWLRGRPTPDPSDDHG